MERYTVRISFKWVVNGNFKVVDDIEENFKTLHKALKIRDCIDETVLSAYIVDNTNGRTVKWV